MTRTCLLVGILLLSAMLSGADLPGDVVSPLDGRGAWKTLQTYTDITAADARAMLDSGVDLVFLDVRTEAEYASGHITEPTDALNMPVGTYLSAHHDELPEAPIIVYCASGSRSRSAAQFLVDQGHSDIYNMLVGYPAWVQLPTRTPTRTPAVTPTATPAPPPGAGLWLLDGFGQVIRLPGPAATPTSTQTPIPAPTLTPTPAESPF